MNNARVLSKVLCEASFPVKVITIAVCFLFCGLIVIFGVHAYHYESLAALFALPMILVSWTFKQRGTVIGVTGILLILAVANTWERGTLCWPYVTLFGFILGGGVFIVEGLGVSFFKHTWEVAQRAEAKAVQAEKHVLQLNQLKTQFLVNVSHELRTPLTQLQGYLELLDESHQQIDAATRAHFIKSAIQGCEELRRLVETVLEAAHSTTGVKAANSETLVVQDVLQDVLARFEPRLREAYFLHIVCPEELTVWADQNYMRQVLSNLLSNAFKFAAKQSEVIISVTLCEHKEEVAPSLVRMCIQDAGPGIPPAEAALLFEPFVRLSRDLSGNVPGTGLGLFICKQLIEVMGGRIWVESTGIAGKGSRFCFTLPHYSSSYPCATELACCQ
ncbi:MAG TPA: HAMP domain-containing sensor histidine kinase [Ktedonobacteraceae bacterium]|nr:HAMP domain-containing sensor histidine kinase [Ktedonobacteraceae bacterium]